MPKTRNFIQESIDTLRRAADKIEGIWKKFQKGEITKAEFEEEYIHIIADNVIDDLESEPYSPNNGCKYKETCPSSNYFAQENI